MDENHLRWDLPGEFLALAVSLEDLGQKTGNTKAKVLALALYWAQALAAQTQDEDLQAHFAPLAKELAANEQEIVEELTAVQGKTADISSYYLPDVAKTEAVMRPNGTFNAALGAAEG